MGLQGLTRLECRLSRTEEEARRRRQRKETIYKAGQGGPTHREFQEAGRRLAKPASRPRERCPTIGSCSG